MPGKPRLHYFDMMKGVAIFMVVMGHVLTFCIRNIDQSVVFKFIGEIHMPLFFFISGWFTCKCTSSGALISPKLSSRFLRLLLPMVVVSTLWIYYFPVSGLKSPIISTWHGLWSSSWKNGYWFTLVLFEILLIYSVFAWTTRKLKIKCAGGFISTAAIFVIASYIIAFYAGISAEYIDWCSFSFTTIFLPVFMFGAIAAKYREKFMAICENPNVYTGSVFIMVASLLATCWYWEIPGAEESLTNYTKPLLHISLAIIALPLFKNWSVRAFSTEAGVATTTVAKIWQYIGKKSLAIYLLHYFFLFPMTDMREPLMSVHLGFAPVFAVAFVTAAVIVALILGLNYVISYSPFFSLILTGEKSGR